MSIVYKSVALVVMVLAVIVININDYKRVQLFVIENFPATILTINEKLFYPYGKTEGLTHQKKPNLHKTTVSIVSYASGDDVHFVNQMELSISAIEQGIDFIFQYRPKDLPDDFVQKNRKILSGKPVAGFGLWKPKIILEVMEHTPLDGVIIFADASMVLKDSIHNLIDEAYNDDRIMIPRTLVKMGTHTKRDCLIILDGDDRITHNEWQLLTCLIILKNSPKNKKTIERWLHYCENEQLISNRRSILAKEHKNFVAHTNEQAIVTLMYIKHKEYFNIKDNNILQQTVNWHHRRNITDGRSTEGDAINYALRAFNRSI
jgi:hypothetical protein